MVPDVPEIPYQQIFDENLSAISVHTLIVDGGGRPVDYRFDAVNRGFESFTGLKAADILGKNVRAILPGTEDVWIERFGQVALTGEPQSFTSYSQEMERWYAVSAFRHKPLGFTVSFLDITDIKRAEEQLQKSGRQFETMVRNMPVGVLLLGPRAEILMGNPRALELLGLTLEQLQGKEPVDPGWRVVHEDGSPFPGSTHPAPRALASRAPVHDVVMGILRPRSEDMVWLLADAEPLLDDQGQVEQLVCTYIDISRRKTAETAWRESEERLERVLEGSQLGYWDWDIPTGKVHRNARWAEMLGYTLEEIELNVRQWTDLHHPDDKARAWTSIQDHLEGRSPIHRIEYRMLCKDGRYKWILDQARVVARDAGGRPLRMSGTHTDIDEQKQAAEAQARLQTQLLQAQKMENLGNLAGGIAHDMNNVLAAILTLSSAKLMRLPENDPHRAAFETIAKAAGRGGKMVKSLLEFARQSPVEEKRLDLNTLIVEEARLLEGTTLEGITLKLSLAPDLKPVLGDAAALAHVLMNLCVNAADAMESLPPPRTLVLRTRNADQGVEVQVEDSGVGMAPEVLQRALDPFFTTKPVGKGTGLGLSLAYATMQAHQGRLTLASEAGRGTVVTLWFQAAAGEGVTPSPADAAPSTSALGVLLIDDDELIRDSLSATLEAGRASVTTAPAGEAALTLLSQGLRPDVVILDMNMPGLGGAETLERLRDLVPEVPVLLSTGRVDQAALNLVTAYPKVTLLAKPFSMDELGRALDKVIPVSSLGTPSETRS